MSAVSPEKKARNAPRRRRHRWWGTHPVTGARWTLSARSAGDLAELVARAQRIGHDYRVGKMTAEEAFAELRFVQIGKPIAHRLTKIGPAWRAYVETLVHPHTRSKAASIWKHHLAKLEDVEIAALSDGRLAELVAEWQRAGLSPKYINHTLWAFLAAAIRHAKRMRQIPRLPWDEFRPPRAVVRRRPASATKVDHLARLLEVARQDDEREEAQGRLGDLARRIVVMGLCGLRNGEAAGLGWDHVDFEAGTITVEYQVLDQWRRHFPSKKRPDFPVKNPSASGPLVQRLHPDALAALLEQREALKKRRWYRAEGPVFPTMKGAWRKNANCIYPEDMKSVAVRAGLPNAARWVTHSLRHSFASLELASGASPRAVQKRIGHASLSMLEQYVHGGEGVGSAIPRLVREASEGKTEREEPPP